MGEVLTLCDLTQSYSETGGGIRTYLTEKRAYIDSHLPYRHLLIVPGKRDRVIQDGRHMTVEIASPRVPGSPNYRLLLRSRAVVKALLKYQPITVECLDAYNLPWAAMKYRRKAGNVSLIAGYRTDFPTCYVEDPARKIIGKRGAKRLKNLAYGYAGNLYSRFDNVYALNSDMAEKLITLGPKKVDVLPLGIDLDTFHPNQRNEPWRAEVCAAVSGPVLVYAGRIDKEKQADVVLDAFLRLPSEMNAVLIMLGEGKLKTELERRSVGKRVHFLGYVKDRSKLAMILASSDIYVSAMAFETFGISIIEAQAAGLPVIGVAAGAMPDRVPHGLGYLGPVGDAAAMAASISHLWASGEVQNMGKKARRHVENNFSWSRTFEHLFNTIYRDAKIGAQF